MLLFWRKYQTFQPFTSRCKPQSKSALLLHPIKCYYDYKHFFPYKRYLLLQVGSHTSGPAFKWHHQTRDELHTHAENCLGPLVRAISTFKKYAAEHPNIHWVLPSISRQQSISAYNSSEVTNIRTKASLTAIYHTRSGHPKDVETCKAAALKIQFWANKNTTISYLQLKSSYNI